MFDDIKVLSIASAMARHAAQRHEVISENVANADTPGYRARDVEDFGEAFARFQATFSAEENDAISNDAWRVLQDTGFGAQSPNGNTVSLEDQMIRSAEAQGEHEMAVTIYRKALDIMRVSLGRR
ncbi:MAG: FlgB family protein [Pseudomonadota bacterium]